LFKNISFLNQIVMKEIKANYYKNGDRVILWTLKKNII
jgi:hypothetical protein